MLRRPNRDSDSAILDNYIDNANHHPNTFRHPYLHPNADTDRYNCDGSIWDSNRFAHT